MNSQQRIDYIKKSEKMVLPEKVATVNRGSAILSRLPKKLQKRIAEGGGRKNPYMGFVVEPYAFFLSYEIADPSKVEALLPRDYFLEPASMFVGGEKKPSIIIGAFNIHTSVFWGSRVETYAIARNRKSGLLSWIILDVQTNTNNYDPGRGFTGPNTSHAVVTTSFKGEVIVDVENAEDRRKLAFTADLENGRKTALDQELWIEGNLSVDYGGELGTESGSTFGLIFDPGEMATALKIPAFSVSLKDESLVSGLTDSRPFEAACFPYAQHFITTSMPESVGISDAWELEQAASSLVGGRPGNDEDAGFMWAAAL